jgi:P pilus assembly chaperone PapD
VWSTIHNPSPYHYESDKQTARGSGGIETGAKHSQILPKSRKVDTKAVLFVGGGVEVVE